MEELTLGQIALLELHARERELGVDPLAFDPPVVIPTEAEPPAPFVIEPVDWYAEEREERERLAAERRAEIIQAAAELEPADPPPQPDPPAAKKRWRARVAA